MPGIRIQILRFVDDGFPGWVECQVADVDGCARLFTEKVPIVSLEYLDANSTYPRPGMIECTVLARTVDTARVRISPLPDDIECEVPNSAVIDDDIWAEP